MDLNNEILIDSNERLNCLFSLFSESLNEKKFS